MEHRTIRGGEKYLPFARTRVAALKLLNTPYASQSFDFGDATVNVSIIPGHEHIRIEGGEQFGYQFTATGDTGRVEQGPPPLDWVTLRAGYSVGCDIKSKPGTGGLPKEDLKVNAYAAGSTAEESPNGEWQFSADLLDMGGFLPHKAPWQISHINEHTYYHSENGELKPWPVLVNAWVSSDPSNGRGINGIGAAKKFLYSGSYATTEGNTYYNTSPVTSFDVTYDVSPSFSTEKKKRPLAGGLTPDSDWYTRAAFRVVNHPEFGRRTFIVMSDVSGTFHVYPTNSETDPGLAQGTTYADQQIKTNVKPGFAQSLRIPFPEWCRQSDGTKACDFYNEFGIEEYADVHKLVSTYPHYQWAFNSTCTKAAAVVFEDMPALVGATTEPWSWRSYTELYPPDAGVTYTVDHGKHGEFPIRQGLPGLLELSIQIEITGENPGDFTFALEVAQAIRPGPGVPFYLDVDYSWGPKPKGVVEVVDGGKKRKVETYPSYGAALDDMVAMTYKFYPAATGYPPYWNELNVVEQHSIGNLEFINLATDTTLFTLLQHRIESSGYWGDSTASYQEFSRTLHAVELRTMSFLSESAYFRFDDDLSLLPGIKKCGGKRVDVMSYGAMEPAVYLTTGEAFNAQMDAFSTDVPPANYEFMDPNYILDATLEWLPHPLTPGTYYWGWPRSTWSAAKAWTFDAYFAAYDFQPDIVTMSPYTTNGVGVLPYTKVYIGSVAYEYALDVTMSLSPHCSFTVHPSGNWSLTSPVIISQTTGLLVRDLTQIQQHFVDIISINTYGEDGADVRTTHLEKFNEAYGKSLTKETFYYKASFGVDKYFPRPNPPEVLDMTHPQTPEYSRSFQIGMRNFVRYEPYDTPPSEYAFFIRGSSLFL